MVGSIRHGRRDLCRVLSLVCHSKSRAGRGGTLDWADENVVQLPYGNHSGAGETPGDHLAASPRTDWLPLVRRV